MFKWWGIEETIHEKATTNIEMWKYMVQARFRRDMWTTLFSYVVWYLWYYRNEAKFKAKHISLVQVIKSIKMKLGYWVKYYKPDFP